MRILTSFAHPDDESYGPGGTLARATRTGHIVSLLTLTHGESGSMGISKSLSSEELAKRRSLELRCAAEKLGIQHLQIHNLSDKQLQDTPEHYGITIIMQEINSVKSDILGKAIQDIAKMILANLEGKNKEFLEKFKNKLGDKYLTEIENMGVNLYLLQLNFNLKNIEEHRKSRQSY